jgi:hypothetical protein
MHKLFVIVGGGDGSPVDAVSKDSDGCDASARDVDTSGKLHGADALLHTLSEECVIHACV